MAFWVYVLQCADGKYYTGHSDDLERRIAQHQTGDYCDFTSRRRPVRLMWSENFPTRIEALEAERRIKPWSRAKKQALFAGDWAAISYFAKPPSERPSTSLGTNGEGAADSKMTGKKIPFVSSVVETPRAPEECPSTSLGTNGEGSACSGSVGIKENPFVSSEVETPKPEGRRSSPPAPAGGGK